MSIVLVPSRLQYPINPAANVYQFHSEILDALREGKTYTDPYTGHILGAEEMITTLENYLMVLHIRFEKLLRVQDKWLEFTQAVDNA